MSPTTRDIPIQWLMRLLRRLYPLLFAVVPALHIAAFNPGRTHFSDLLMVTGSLLLVFGLIYLLVSGALGAVRRGALAPIVVMGIVAWFYSVALTDLLLPTTVRHATIVLITLLGASTALAWLHQRSRLLEQIDSILAMTGILLVGWSTLRIGIDVLREHRAITSSQIAKELTTPVEVKQVGNQASRRPTIYLIVLDEYANSNILKEQFGFGNREFEDSLRRLGFTIPRLLRSNYTQTTLSLPSLLNFAQLSAVSRELGPRATDPSLPDYLLENNRTARFLKTRGYQFAFFPSEWWPATAHSSYADREFRVWHDFDLRHVLARTELRRHLWIHTLLGGMGSPDMVDPEFLQQTFEGLRQLDTQGRPTFVFAHMLLPHTPYVFDSDCRPRTEPDEPNRQLYLNQLRCTNRLVLNLVTTLLQRPGQPPVILLQGDHGTAMLDFGSAPSPGRVTPAQARERFGAFGAYFLPGGGGQLFADSLTLVNVFPKVLNFYLGADLPLGPDDLYMSLYRAPFDFARVDPRALK